MAEQNQKKKKKKWILPVVIIGVLAVLIYFGATAIRESRRVLADAQTRTAAAKHGSVELSVAGSGSLTADDSADVKIPALLEIDEILVEVGDVVQAGDPLATLDSVALQSAITEVQDEIATIDEQIDEAESTTEESEIEASVAGRVKEIAVTEGDSVSQTVAQAGHLMILSLDGTMKVEVESGAQPETGSSVTVGLPDGSAEEGEVVSSGASSFIVSLTDDGPEAGQTVSIQNEDGQALGDGVLEVNAPLNVVGGNGTVKSVDVELNDKVGKGASLLTLQSTTSSREYQDLAQQRIQYEELLRILLQYAETNTITADIAGSITEIQAGQSVSSAETSSDLDVSGILSNLPISAQNAEEGIVFDTLAHTTANTAQALTLETNAGETGEYTLASSGDPQDPPTTVTEIVGVIDVPVAAPVLAGTPQVTIAPGAGYTGTVAWEPAASFFVPETAYTAVVVLKAEPGFRFANDIQVTIAGAVISELVVSQEAEQNIVAFRAAFPPTAALPQDVDLEQYINDILQDSIGQAANGLGDSLGSLGNIGGSFSIDSSALGQGTTTSAPSTAMAAAFTITPGQAYSIIAEIDEVDIFSIAVGQDVNIVMDALLDDMFHGTVTKISTVGTSQSGVTTYPVTIRLDPADTPLLGGMNATANIVTKVSENALLIPLEALQEQGEERFVYIYDPNVNLSERQQNDQPLGEVRTVTTGISDGVNVEITSGLQEGEEVVYTVTESNAFLEAIMSMSGESQGASSPQS
ncbi:biotin/lipoyl-binding protein [Christensenellaceae bacterium OttesenSCG-928-K19]|nr:biotin/lipoyl-binding protein [Christensenellaceae bacterium OttesenSCG-928-K19]